MKLILESEHSNTLTDFPLRNKFQHLLIKNVEGAFISLLLKCIYSGASHSDQIGAFNFEQYYLPFLESCVMKWWLVLVFVPWYDLLQEEALDFVEDEDHATHEESEFCVDKWVILVQCVHTEGILWCVQILYTDILSAWRNQTWTVSSASSENWVIRFVIDEYAVRTIYL